MCQWSKMARLLHITESIEIFQIMLKNPMTITIGAIVVALSQNGNADKNSNSDVANSFLLFWFNYREAYKHVFPLWIVQLHFVGFDREGDLLIDGHSHATNLEIWQLLEEVVRYAPVCGAILERDEQLPPFSDILTELANMREIMNRDFVKT